MFAINLLANDRFDAILLFSSFILFARLASANQCDQMSCKNGSILENLPNIIKN